MQSTFLHFSVFYANLLNICVHLIHSIPFFIQFPSPSSLVTSFLLSCPSLSLLLFYLLSLPPLTITHSLAQVNLIYHSSAYLTSSSQLIEFHLLFITECCSSSFSTHSPHPCPRPPPHYNKNSVVFFFYFRRLESDWHFEKEWIMNLEI